MTMSHINYLNSNSSQTFLEEWIQFQQVENQANPL